jgi:heat-inducible transcriptional repressor
LEREGYLTHPHTSAGRVPTDKAYRFYVDSLVELQRLAIKEEERIRQEHESRIREINELMLSTSKTLSVLSNYTGFVTAPGIDQSRLQHMELIPLDSRRLLAVMVSDTGVVKHRQVVFDGPIRGNCWNLWNGR